MVTLAPLLLKSTARICCWRLPWFSWVMWALAAALSGQQSAAKTDESWVKLYEAQSKIDLAAHGETAENPANALRDAANSSDVPAAAKTRWPSCGWGIITCGPSTWGTMGRWKKVDIDEAPCQAGAGVRKGRSSESKRSQSDCAQRADGLNRQGLRPRTSMTGPRRRICTRRSWRMPRRLGIPIWRRSPRGT